MGIAQGRLNSTRRGTETPLGRYRSATSRACRPVRVRGDGRGSSRSDRRFPEVIAAAAVLMFAVQGHAQPSDEAAGAMLVVVDCAAPSIDVREVERVLRATLWPMQLHVRRKGDAETSPA